MPLMTDVLIQDLAFDTDPTGGKPALALRVHRLVASLGDPWLEKMARMGLAAAAGKTPVGLTYVASRFLPDGAELTVKAGEGLLSVTPTLRLEIAGEADGRVRVKVAEIRSSGMVPVEKLVNPAIEKLIETLCARPGVLRHPAGSRAVLLDLNLLLGGTGFSFAEGVPWTIGGEPGILTVRLG
jgi:hypothetical protein